MIRWLSTEQRDNRGNVIAYWAKRQSIRYWTKHINVMVLAAQWFINNKFSEQLIKCTNWLNKYILKQLDMIDVHNKWLIDWMHQLGGFSMIIPNDLTMLVLKLILKRWPFLVLKLILKRWPFLVLKLIEKVVPQDDWLKTVPQDDWLI